MYKSKGVSAVFYYRSQFGIQDFSEGCIENISKTESYFPTLLPEMLHPEVGRTSSPKPCFSGRIPKLAPLTWRPTLYKTQQAGIAKIQPMTKKEKATWVSEELEKLYPEVPVPLDHTDPYTLLVAVLLSAQCTDVRVNQVTPALFRKASTPADMVKLSVEEIKDIIRPCGLSPAKSKAIHSLSGMLLRDHSGNVPQSWEYLESLPGVGHKTASVVMSQAFGVPAFPVDTHIHRLMHRWGLTTGKNVEKTEADAKRLFPERLWNKLHLQIIFYGREYSPARGLDLRKDFITRLIGRKAIVDEWMRKNPEKLQDL